MGGLLESSAEVELPTSYRYSLVSRILAAALIIVISLPLAYVLVFLATHLPALSDLGPLLIGVLFVLVPPVLITLRFAHYFRSFEVEPQRLAVSTLWMRWEVPWRDITRIVRRTRPSTWRTRFYRVRVEVQTTRGGIEWVELFDSDLSGSDQLYAQVLRHAPQLRSREIVDDLSPRRP